MIDAVSITLRAGSAARKARCLTQIKLTSHRRALRERHDSASRRVRLKQITTCLDCGGKGTIIDAPCPECGDRGEVHQDEVLTVRIPVGAEEGMASRIPGRGTPAQRPAQPPGDPFVIVDTARDSRFERHERDLNRVESVDVIDAVLGTSLDVPTLDGPVSIKIPKGTQPDSLLRLRGNGLPRFSGDGRGDLYVRVRVQIPERLPERHRSLFEQLRTASSKQRA